MPDPFQERVQYYTGRVNKCLDAALPGATSRPRRLHEAMRYAVLNGGKRIRPLLMYATGECLGVNENLLDKPAVTIELIHAFSLVHDDLPAMDDDDLRRGKPTVHKQYDEATAILAADALQPLAFSILTTLPDTPERTVIELVRLITTACGSTGMTGGQSIDLAAEGHHLSATELESMYALKTGALIHASIMSAGLLCNHLSASDLDSLHRFAETVGVAFQIKDDILDVEGEPDVIGKPVGSDVLLNKATYPALFGMDASHRRCDELLDSALQDLAPFGHAAEPLEWLARYIVARGQ